MIVQTYKDMSVGDTVYALPGNGINQTWMGKKLVVTEIEVYDCGKRGTVLNITAQAENGTKLLFMNGELSKVKP